MLKIELLLLTSQGWDIHLDLIKLYLSGGSKSRKFNTERIRGVFLIHPSSSPSPLLALIFRLGSRFSFKHWILGRKCFFLFFFTNFLTLCRVLEDLDRHLAGWMPLASRAPLSSPQKKTIGFVFFISFSTLNLSDSKPVWAGMNQPLALRLELIMNNWPRLLVRHMLRMSD